MAAYAAGLSLRRTLRQLQLSNHLFSNTPNYNPKFLIKVLANGVDSLKRFLDENREIKSDFETEIRDAIYEAEDLIDSHLSLGAEISQSFYEDLGRVMKKIRATAKMTTTRFNHLTLDRKISVSTWREKAKYNENPPIVGRSEDIVQLKGLLLGESASLEAVSIVGIPGMGKSALARSAFKDRSIYKHFECSGFVRVRIEYHKRDVLLSLLESLGKPGEVIRQNTDDQLAKYLYNSLKNRRYLVVLDNIRDAAVWNDLKESFPDYNNGSRILLTTRNMDVIAAINGPAPHLLDRLSDEDTLALLENIVFVDESCPPELAVIAKAIAKSCRGLPLAVIIVGRLLGCAELSVEYWNIVLSSIYASENYAELVEALVSLTYKHLPQYLKPFFLYMAIFPYEYDIRAIELVNLFVAEGFVASYSECVSLEYRACDHLLELIDRGVACQSDLTSGAKGVVCSIREEVFHDFIRRKAKEEKFFLVINNNTKCFLQEDATFTQQRRLGIHKNIHQCIKDLSEYNSSKASISIARSLIYSGIEHQYPFRGWLDFRLLKVLDAAKIRFYSFPTEILKLFQLRYLAISYNGQLPATVCKLHNLQFLIILRYLSFKCSGAPSYLPVEIWNMKELRHLQVMGSDLPDPPPNSDLVLENLLVLFDVSVHSCTKKILERIPNLTHLRFQIESSSEGDSWSFFNHLYVLSKLLTFEHVVIYPDMGSQIVPSSILAFPSTLQHLTLSGCGFPWENMRVIAVLPHLHVLELLSYAFQGTQWELKEDEFRSLHLLVLEDMDLKEWIFADELCFPKLEFLIIKNCYKLREIPLGFGDISSLKMMKVVDCSTSVMESAKQIEEKQYDSGNESIDVDLRSSWKD